MSEKLVRELAEAVGGTITEVSGPLPDGSGFAMISMPLPKDHWLYTDPGYPNHPPAGLKMGSEDRMTVTIERAGKLVSRQVLTREQIGDYIRAAVRYGYKAASMDGKENDIDPDALVQNAVCGLIGYWTVDGDSTLD